MCVSVIITITRTTRAQTENKWPDKKAIGKYYHIMYYYYCIQLVHVYNNIQAAHVVIKNDDVLHTTPPPPAHHGVYAAITITIIIIIILIIIIRIARVYIIIYSIYPLNARRPSNHSLADVTHARIFLAAYSVHVYHEYYCYAQSGLPVSYSST